MPGPAHCNILWTLFRTPKLITNNKRERDRQTERQTERERNRERERERERERDPQAYSHIYNNKKQK